MEPIGAQATIAQAIVSFSHEKGLSILESSLRTSQHDRYSVLAFDPVTQVSLAGSDIDCPFRALEASLSPFPRLVQRPDDPPFVGGWIGFITYEAGAMAEGIQRTARWDLPLPWLRFQLYDTLAIYDHQQRQWYVAAVDWPASFAHRRPAVSERMEKLRSLLAAAADIDDGAELTAPRSTPPRSNMTHDDYVSRVKRIKHYIESGDIYQANFTQRFETRTNISPMTLYRHLRRVNPSGRAALLLGDRVSIISASPELFLDLRDGHVVTRPIKGTRPRVGEELVDRRARHELECSDKDRAELTMIIDLLRNDLGRVCAPGTIHVCESEGIEAHPTVFHRVAAIEGDLEPAYRWPDLLAAAFPGGSITGAPKIRAMQIINELEPTARGVYCGSLGWIGLDGSMSLNIAIRTMVQTAKTVYVYAGGAIVAESVPEREYEESIAKATGMFRALGCSLPLQTPQPVEAVAP